MLGKGGVNESEYLKGLFYFFSFFQTKHVQATDSWSEHSFNTAGRLSPVMVLTTNRQTKRKIRPILHFLLFFQGDRKKECQFDSSKKHFREADSPKPGDESNPLDSAADDKSNAPLR